MHRHPSNVIHTNMLTIQNLIYTQLKTDSKQRSETDKRQQHGTENMAEYQKKSAQKAKSGEDNSPAVPAKDRTRDLPITSHHSKDR